MKFSKVFSKVFSNVLVSSVAGLIAFIPNGNAGSNQIAQNKELVRKFYDQAFNRHQPKEAALAYLSEGYVQHNPHVATGRKGFIDAFSDAGKKSDKKDESQAVFKRFIAEDDLVVLHSHKHEVPGDRGVAGVDIFRIKDGKITEHWDVNQKIPEDSKNSNTMF